MAARSVGRSSVLALTGVIAQGGFRVITNILIGRFAGVTVLGQSSGLLAAAQIMTLLGPSSLGAAQTRYVARANAGSSAHPTFAAGVVRHVRRRVLLVAAVVGAAAAALWALTLGTSWHTISVLLAVGWGLMIYTLAKSHLLALGRLGRLATAEVLTAGLGLLASVVLLALGVRDLNLLWPVAGAAWLCAAIIWVPNRGGDLAAVDRREIDTFAMTGVAGTLVSAGFMQSSVLIASHVIGGLEAGHYAAAFALATPLSLVTTSVGMVLFPAFARSLDRESTRTLIRRSLRGMLLVVIPPMCFLMFVAPEVTRVVWGEDFAPAAPLLPLLMCAIAMSGAGLAGSQALTSVGVEGMRTSLKVGVVGAALGVAIWMLLVPETGTTGVAVGYACGTAVTSCLPLLVMARRLRVSPWRYVTLGWLMPLGAALVSFLCVTHDISLWIRLVTATAWALVTLALVRGLPRAPLQP